MNNTSSFNTPKRAALYPSVRLLGVALIALAATSATLWPSQAASPPASVQDPRPAAAQSQPRQAMREREQLVLTAMTRGVAAYNDGNSAAAVAAFDEADRVAGGMMFLNPDWHAIRALSFENVGRKEDALRDARLAYDFVRGGPTVSKEIRDRFNASNESVDLDAVYSMAFIFRKYNDSRAEAATEALLSLTPTDAPGFTNRASFLSELARHDEAIQASTRALSLWPNEPAILNNHCHILTVADRARDALPFCRRAVRLAPNFGAIRSSYSSAFAKLGECTKAREQKTIALRLDPRSEEALKPLECTPKR
jgi:Flp pilus assembly protein TadD